MIALIMQKLGDGAFMASLFAAIGAVAAVLTVGLPLLDRGDMQKRIKAAALERDSIRQRERERMSKGDKQGLRAAPTRAYMKNVVDRFRLGDWLGTETAKVRLVQAGYRGQQAEVAFLFFRLVMPIALFVITLIYVFGILDLKQPAIIRLGIALFAAYLGMKLPEIFLTNKIQKRQESIKKAFPDALDLLLICVESGMSIEHAFRKVGAEVGRGSAPLAEEMTLTTAELSYLSERRQAYQNLADRTGLDGVKSITTALIQAERYGTPVGAALRVLAQENRDQRMNEAEKKAAALPPKLTVPMILFFLPVLFAVILTPAMIQIFKWD